MTIDEINDTDLLLDNCKKLVEAHIEYNSDTEAEHNLARHLSWCILIIERLRETKYLMIS